MIIVKNINLCELYLSCNAIVNSNSINHLENLEKLHILDLSQNPICELLNYPYFVIHALKRLYYLDGNVISKFAKRPSFNKSTKIENSLSNTLQVSQSITSSHSNGFFNGHYLDIDRASAKYLYEDGQISAPGKSPQHNLRNGRPHSLGGADFLIPAPSQRSTITGAHRMSSVGSIEPIEENILYENKYSEPKTRSKKNNTSLNKKDKMLEFNEGKENAHPNISKAFLNKDKENLTNYCNTIAMDNIPKTAKQDRLSGLDTETPELDELLQTSLLKNCKNNTVKSVNNKHRTQSQEYPDPFYQAMEDVKGFVNRIKMDKNKENPTNKSSFLSKLPDGELVSASVSQIGTPRTGKYIYK